MISARKNRARYKQKYGGLRLLRAKNCVKGIGRDLVAHRHSGHSGKAE